MDRPMRRKSTAASSAIKGKKKMPVPKRAAPPPTPRRDLTGKELFPERGINLSELDDSPIPVLVNNRFWTSLVRQPWEINETLVREFYSIVKFDDFDDLGFVIRGKFVDLSVDAINAYFDIHPDHQGDQFDSSLWPPSVEVKEGLKAYRNVHLPLGKLEYSELSESLTFMCKWIRFSLLPRSKPNEMTDLEIVLLESLNRGLGVNIGSLILEELRRAVENIDKGKSKFLIFPSLISGLCAKVGVTRRASDTILPKSPILGSFTWHQILSSRGGKKNSKRRKFSGNPTAEEEFMEEEVGGAEEGGAGPSSGARTYRSSIGTNLSAQYSSIMGNQKCYHQDLKNFMAKMLNKQEEDRRADRRREEQERRKEQEERKAEMEALKGYIKDRFDELQAQMKLLKERIDNIELSSDNSSSDHTPPPDAAQGHPTPAATPSSRPDPNLAAVLKTPLIPEK